MNNEKELIDNCKKGNLVSFEGLIKPYESRIYNFLSKMCNDRDIAEDLMQETFINAFNNIQQFQSKAKFSTWLFKIAVNHCLMHKRNSKSAPQILEYEFDDDSFNIVNNISDSEFDPALLYAKKEIKEYLGSALNKLPKIYKSVFILKDIEGFKAKEIADMINLPLSTVKARILRARLKLNSILKEIIMEPL
jgi:RNA polymerase sigma-70 factor, ECF subfamily